MPILHDVRIDDTCPAEIITQAFVYYAEHERILLAAFVVMPDHWHAILAIPNESGLADVMSAMNRWISGRTNAALADRHVAWQDGYHDARIYTRQAFANRLAYVEANPVRAGLVEKPGDWRWSSAHPDFSHSVLRPWPGEFPG